MTQSAWLLTALLAQPIPPADLPMWMVGDWGCYAHPVPRGGPISTEEYWLATGDGRMVGVGRVRQYRTRALEHMRIAPDDVGRLTFYGSPGGAAPVAFPRVRSGDREIVFENPSHDFPQRISYRLDGDRLVATVSKIDGSDVQSWHFGRTTTMREQGPRCNPAPD